MAYGQADGYYADQLQQEGIEVQNLRLRRGGDILRLPSVRRAIRSFPVHHFHVAELVPMLASACCPGVTRVYTHRGGAAKYPLGKALGYRSAGVILRCCFHGLSGNTRHACVSGAQVLGLPEAGWEVTYNGLDFSLLSARAPRATVAQQHGIRMNGQAIIGTSANLRSWKRIDWLLKACSLIKDIRFTTVIVGDGPDRPRLESVTDALGLRGRVVFTGRQEYVADYLGLMDIFVLPSNSEESFGNSVVEAMAMGLPSLVFRDGGGLTEHVEDGRSGFVVGSVEDLALRIRQLIADPELRRSLGRAASVAVRDRYSLEAMVERYDRLYKSALERNRR
jgi:glycosyltransferase involved in cell wall biosynthesis